MPAVQLVLLSLAKADCSDKRKGLTLDINEIGELGLATHAEPRTLWAGFGRSVGAGQLSPAYSDGGCRHR